MDLNAIRLQPGDAEKILAARAEKAKRSPTRRRSSRRSSDWFIAGPIPGSWVEAAAKLPGRSLNVALATWHAVRKSRDGVAVLSHTILSDFGIHRASLARALERLESAGLVRVHRHRGRAPRVEIVLPEVDGADSNGAGV